SAKDGGYGVSPLTLVDGNGHRISFIDRPVSTFEAEKYVVRPNDVARLSIPLKAGIADFVDGQVVVQLSEDWKAGASTIRAGSVPAFDAKAALREPGALAPVTVFEPGPRESAQGISATRDRLFVDITQNVKGKVLVASRAADGRWTSTPMPLPDNVSTSVVAA